ncbi:neuraminidase [Apiospora arundinis]
MQLKLSTFLALCGLVLGGQCTANSTKPEPFGLFGDNPIYWPDANHTMFYPRITELSDGTILATAGLNSSPMPVFPIFSSSDGGASWEWISNMTDQVNGLGMNAQPALAELTFDLSESFPAGTVLASGNSWSPIGGKNSTNIDLYASHDKGRTWKFVSNVARGGGPNTTNGTPCIWEPYILPYEEDGTIGVFYSDQRDPLHGQKLAHQVSKDLLTWGPVVNDVAYKTYTDRPGMTVMAYLPPLKKWILVYEYPGTPPDFPGGDSWNGQAYPVYYRFASTPFTFDNDRGYPIVAGGGVQQPGSSPYVVWSPSGGPNGTIIVSDNDHSDVFTNSHAGAPDRWEVHATPQPNAYSRALHVPRGYPDHLMILGAARFSRKVPRPLSISVVSVKELLTQPPGDAGGKTSISR